MPADGPPWTPGSNCNVSLAHASVSAGVAQGFFVKPDSYRVLLPKIWYPGTNILTPVPERPINAGERVIEFTVIAEDRMVHSDGQPSFVTAAEWQNALRAYLSLVNTAMTFRDPQDVAWTVAIEEYEERLSPLGGQFALRWETRVVLVQD